MPQINITTERGRVQASVSGSSTRMMGNVRGDLDLDQSTMRGALEDLYTGRGYYENVMLFGYAINLTPLEDEIEIEESSKIISVANDVLRNESRVTGTYSSSLEHRVEHSVDVTWSSSKQVTKGFSIGGEFYVKASAHMDFTTTTGKRVSKKKSEVVGSKRQLSVTLRPGERVNVSLQVKRRHIRVTVPFRVDITGHVAGQFSVGQPVTFDLKDVLRAAGKRSSYRTEAVVDITCFTDADVTMYDP